MSVAEKIKNYIHITGAKEGSFLAILNDQDRHDFEPACRFAMSSKHRSPNINTYLLEGHTLYVVPSFNHQSGIIRLWTETVHAL